LSVARLACPAVQADETVSMLAAAPEIGLLTRTSAEQPTPLRVARLACPAVEKPSGNHGWASQPCHTPPAAAVLVASADPLPSSSAPWSPAMPDTIATDSTLAADDLVDALALPALDVRL